VYEYAIYIYIIYMHMKCIHSATNINLKNIVILLYVKLKKKNALFSGTKSLQVKIGSYRRKKY
jgi:hypothetical protein